MKVGELDERYQGCLVGSDRLQVSGLLLRQLMRVSNNWKKQFTPRPEKVERKNMELKEFKKTKAYKQLRKFIEVNVPDVEKRPAQLGIMVKRTMARLDPEYWNNEGFDQSIGWLCAWGDTPEGLDFWEAVHNGHPVDNLHPCPIKPKKEKVAVKPQKPIEEKPNRVGWW